MIYDAIIMVIPENIKLLEKAFPYLCENLGAESIVFVANDSCRSEIDKAFAGKGYRFLNEDEIFTGMTLLRIKEILLGLCGDSHRAGWFYQQFLKMAYAYKCENRYYLVFDSDTIPLRKIQYFDEDGKPQFIIKREYHAPYFETMKVLFDGEVGRFNRDVSYIAENMIIKKDIMIEIIDKIMDNPHLCGEAFYERILNSISRDVVKDTGFSEFETYGNYVMTFYPGVYNEIRLHTQRRGTFLFGNEPSDEQLRWASKDYDIISFENNGRTWLADKTKDEKIRQKYNAARLFKKYIWLNDLIDRLRFREVIDYDD